MHFSLFYPSDINDSKVGDWVHKNSIIMRQGPKGRIYLSLATILFRKFRTFRPLPIKNMIKEHAIRYSLCRIDNKEQTDYFGPPRSDRLVQEWYNST